MPSESAILLQPSKRLKTCRFWARFKTFCLSAFRTLAEYSSPSTCTCRKNQWCERLVFSVFRPPRDTAPLLIRADSRTHRLETRNRGETQRPTGRDAATPPGNLSAAASRISDWEAIETTPDRACLAFAMEGRKRRISMSPHKVVKALD